MIKQLMMSPAIALYHWRVNRMSMAQVLSHTGYTRWSELSNELEDQIESTDMALQDRLQSPDERQRVEDVEAVWDGFGDYMREMVPPSEYDDEIERLLPLVVSTRQIKTAAISKPFRDAVRRRKSLQ